MSETLNVYEVGPRDGLQGHRKSIATAAKVELIRALAGTGLRDIEATSFVSPRAVPQMADAKELLAALGDGAARYFALVVNDKGYDRALAAGARAVSIVAVMTEALSQENSRMAAAESLAMAIGLAKRARTDGLACRVYLAPAWVCPYEGPVAPEVVLSAAERLWHDGACQLALADTLGHAHPGQVGSLCQRVGERTGIAALAVHLHDTQALGLANAAAAIAAGVRTVDASIGGLGGCPFAPGAAGNLATEDLVLMAHKMGFNTGIDLDALWRAVDLAAGIVSAALGGRTGAWWRSQREKSASKEAIHA